MKLSRAEQDNKALKELLRDLRLEANLRQEDVAERLHVPQSFVSKYESGERRLDVLEIRSLCRVFGVTLLDFVSRLEAKLNVVGQ
jgi:transcriptional regulator with XRE-family HTH domain